MTEPSSQVSLSGVDTPVVPPQFTRADFHPQLVDNPGHFVRGLVFDTFAALAGMAIYAAVGIVTGLELGLVSLLIGYIVGRGVLLGSRGRRGRRYQIAAVALTYVSVSLSSLPIAIAQVQHEQQEPSSTSAAVGANRATDDDGAGDRDISLGRALVIGLASPFLGLTSNLGSGLMGLAILYVGVQIAWRMTGSMGAPAAAHSFGAQSRAIARQVGGASATAEGPQRSFHPRG